jgi:hypothetical protein
VNLSSLKKFKKLQDLEEHIQCDVIKGLQHDIQQSENLHVDKSDWRNFNFIRFLRGHIMKLLNSLREEKVTSDDWATWGKLDDWSYAAFKLPDLFNVVAAEMTETTEITNDRSLHESFQSSLQHLISFKHQAQPAVRPQRV